MKKIAATSKMIFIFTLLLVFLTQFSIALAQTTPPNEYEVLVPLPGISGKVPLTNYLPAIFKLSIGIAAALAFVTITFGGIMYATSDAITRKDEGRKYIENALWGLLLVIGAYIILYTINPQTLDFSFLNNLQNPSIPTATSSVAVGTDMTAQEIAASNAVKAQLAAVGVQIYNNAGPCTKAGQTTGCVSLNGLSTAVITGLGELSKRCQCTPVISGGTEGGHSAGGGHGSGNSVDLLPNPAIDKVVVPTNTKKAACNIFTPTPLAGTFLWEPKGSFCGGSVASSGDHWHVGY